VIKAAEAIIRHFRWISGVSSLCSWPVNCFDKKKSENHSYPVILNIISVNNNKYILIIYIHHNRYTAVSNLYIVYYRYLWDLKSHIVYDLS